MKSVSARPCSAIGVRPQSRLRRRVRPDVRSPAYPAGPWRRSLRCHCNPGEPGAQRWPSPDPAPADRHCGRALQSDRRHDHRATAFHGWRQRAALRAGYSRKRRDRRTSRHRGLAPPQAGRSAADQRGLADKTRIGSAKYRPETRHRPLFSRKTDVPPLFQARNAPYVRLTETCHKKRR